ncbi:host attachment family protein [Litorimonas sp. RW-G-Af-16]|uniref:host attachment family protein n=1 Tax=Litorimonas sp. RW-G-Af-16 TaxID=3241168 RepID=UPI00390C4752
MSDLKLPHNTLVVVASGEEANLFRMKDGGLRSYGHWTPGDLADQGPSGKTPPDMSDQELNEATFSKIIAEKLYSMAHAGDFQKLVLCADPNTLGEIRPLLHDEVNAKMLHEVDKTLINSSIDDIERSISKAID